MTVPPLFNFRCLLIESVEDCNEFLRWLGERRPVLAIDTETTGLFPYTHDRIRVVQFGDGAAGWVVPYDEWRGVIRQALTQYDGQVVGHNWNFDRAFLEQAGMPHIPVHRAHDTMTMSHILNPARSHGLKQSADRYWPGASAAEAFLKEGFQTNKWNWETVPIEFVPYWTYAASDVVWTARLWEKWTPEIEVRGLTEVFQRETAINDIAYRMQRRGLRIDVDYTSGLLDTWLVEMAEVEEDLHALGVANPSAGQQVAQALQITEDWEPDAWTETGLPKVDEKVLIGINSDIARKVLRYRRLRKWTGAYLQRFLGYRDANGYVHPDLKPLRARTGRWSITQPPLQTLPRGAEIRDCVIPDDGNAIWAIDYDTMEMRAFAHYSQEPGLIAAIQAGEDLHTFVAREVYQDPSITKDDPRRQLAKNTQFCLVYGGGAAKIAETAGVEEPVARTFLDAYKSKFSGVQSFMDTVDRMGRQRLADTGKGYITTYGGRYTPCDDDRIYALLNYLIQGSCADVFKMKMIALDASGFSEHMMLPVHDEVLFQFPEGDTTSAVEAKRIMEDYEMLAVPLTCETSGPFTRWGDKYAVGR